MYGRDTLQLSFDIRRNPSIFLEKPAAFNEACIARKQEIPLFVICCFTGAASRVGCNSTRRTRLKTSESQMGDIVNLRRFRKRAAKQRDDERAAANRSLHGRTKAQRVLETSREEKLRRDFDAHKIETGETR